MSNNIVRHSPWLTEYKRGNIDSPMSKHFRKKERNDLANATRYDTSHGGTEHRIPPKLLPPKKKEETSGIQQEI